MKTVTEIATEYGVSRQYVLKLINKGRLRAVRMGQQWFSKDNWISNSPLKKRNK